MTTSSALEDLYRRAPMGMRLGLEPMREACARCDHPERGLRAVHVAGTNGKGSVCAMVESMARASGVRTGLYTSPHLSTFAERIRIDGKPIEDLERPLRAALDLGPDLSFFEAATLAAFLALRDAKVELAILEVGLGGRLDATNVVADPMATAVTRIALDHTDLLGTTLDAIAFEKASIAKPNVPMVIGERNAAIEKTCADLGGRIVLAKPMTDVDDVDVPRIGLAGDHQKQNAAIAWTLAEIAGIPQDARRTGLAKVEWPGRLERIGDDVLLDAAHNPDGARALAAFLAPDPRRRALVFGALADKAWPEMLDVLAPLFSHRVYTLPKGRSAAPLEELSRRHAGEACPDPIEALARARASGAELVVVCGSLYLIGEVRSSLLGLRRDPPVAL